jgi:hypothetical protein
MPSHPSTSSAWPHQSRQRGDPERFRIILQSIKIDPTEYDIHLERTFEIIFDELRERQRKKKKKRDSEFDELGMLMDT